MSAFDWLIIWRDCFVVITWFAALVYLLSGGQDLVYDVGALCWRLYRRIRFADRERLSLARLRLREQQRIAVFVPAWNEGDVVSHMVENILHRVDYRNYTIFVGTYCNDPATQHAVDVLAAAHPGIIKVVVPQPGPTNKAHCLNTVYRAMQAYEQANGVYFDLIVMHDAEDVVHPHSFLLYNYLIPRVDAVQLPILPLPVPHQQWVHWIYADEFAENHMKDVIAREKMGGFVPFAGVGTGFSRRMFSMLETLYRDAPFNESSMTEDYSLAKKIRDAGMKSVFVNLVLKDDDSPWHTPLAHRSHFIANWSYFPKDFIRSVRQKTRWIIGISLQEWEHGGWSGNLVVNENLIKDRKVFIASMVTFLGYLVLLYGAIYLLGQAGVLPFHWLPLFTPGSVLPHLLGVVTVLMFVRAVQRIAYVGMVYGVVAGLLSVPRTLIANVINGYAALRALNIFSNAREGKGPVRWDKTDHQEGVGQMPVNGNGTVGRMATAEKPVYSLAGTLELLNADGSWEIIRGLELIPAAVFPYEERLYSNILHELSADQDHHIRAAVARVVGYLHWGALAPIVCELLYDREWVVRANAAKALLKFADFELMLNQIFLRDDPYAREVTTRAIEQDERAQRYLLPRLDQENMTTARNMLLSESFLLRNRYLEWLVANGSHIDELMLPQPSLHALERTHEPAAEWNAESGVLVSS